MNNKKAKSIKSLVFEKFYDVPIKSGNRKLSPRIDIRKAMRETNFKAVYRVAKKRYKNKLPYIIDTIE